MSLGLGLDLDPNLFCKSAWGDNDGSGGKYWPRNLSKRPQSCVVDGDHDGGDREWPMDSVCPNRAQTGHVSHIQSQWRHTQGVPEAG